MYWRWLEWPRSSRLGQGWYFFLLVSVDYSKNHQTYCGFSFSYMESGQYLLFLAQASYMEFTGSHPFGLIVLGLFDWGA